MKPRFDRAACDVELRRSFFFGKSFEIPEDENRAMVGFEFSEHPSDIACKAWVERATLGELEMIDQRIPTSSFRMPNRFPGSDPPNPTSQRTRITKPSQVSHHLDQGFLRGIWPGIERDRATQPTDPGREPVEYVAHRDQVSALGCPNEVEI